MPLELQSARHPADGKLDPTPGIRVALLNHAFDILPPISGFLAIIVIVISKAIFITTLLCDSLFFYMPGC